MHGFDVSTSKGRFGTDQLLNCAKMLSVDVTTKTASNHKVLNSFFGGIVTIALNLNPHTIAARSSSKYWTWDIHFLVEFH